WPVDLQHRGHHGSIADAASGCEEMKGGDFAKLEMKGDAAVQGKIKGFLTASYGLNKASVEARAELISASNDLPLALGAVEADLKGKTDDETAEKSCNVAA